MRDFVFYLFLVIQPAKGAGSLKNKAGSCFTSWKITVEVLPKDACDKRKKLK